MLTIHNLIYSRFKQIKTGTWVGGRQQSGVENMAGLLLKTILFTKVRQTSFVLFMEISVVLTAVAKTSQRTCTACWRGRLQLATNWSEVRTAERHRERKVPTCTTVWWDQWPAIPHRKNKKQNRTKSQDFTIIHQLARATLPAIAWVSGSKIPLCRMLEKCSKLPCYCRIRPTFSLLSLGWMLTTF